MRKNIKDSVLTQSNTAPKKCHDITPLIEAMLSGNEYLAVECLNNGEDPNAGMMSGCKPIHLAASSDISPDFLKKLIAAGADVNARDQYFGKTALHMACRRWLSHYEIIQVLLDAGADPTIDDGNGYSLSDYAMIVATNREFGCKHGINIYEDSPLYPIPYNQSHARLVLAAKEGDLRALKSQLEMDIPDKIMTLALHETLIRRKYECCQLLLDDGANPNGMDYDGFTPLAYAATCLEVDIAKLLLSYGAEPENGNSGGQKPLYLACQSGIDESPEDIPERRRLNIVALLLKHGADVDGADNDGWTPLRLAIDTANDMQLVRLLLQHGARPDRKDNSGITPLQLAEQSCSKEMVELLRKSQFASSGLSTAEKGEAL
jgi:ankyrin repeat protein